MWSIDEGVHSNIFYNDFNVMETSDSAGPHLHKQKPRHVALCFYVAYFSFFKPQPRQMTRM